MDHIEGTKRNQLILFPQSLDEYVREDNPVRFIDAYVESLDLEALGFRHIVPQETGRPPYHPGMLHKLYLYGYLNHIRSSRLLEKEAQRNVEVLWLTGKLMPDDKTIANFRRENREAIRGVYRDFTRLCRQTDLFDGELVAIDGSKFKAVNNHSRKLSYRKLKRVLEEIEKKIDHYLRELDENDARKPEERKFTTEELKDKIERVTERKEEYQGLQQRMKESGSCNLLLIFSP